MHPDLSSHLHISNCNKIIEALKKCHEENPWKKFLGHCNDLDQELNKCIREEREKRRKANRTKKDINILN